jgi:hypothetical protein
MWIARDGGGEGRRRFAPAELRDHLVEPALELGLLLEEVLTTRHRSERY